MTTHGDHSDVYKCDVLEYGDRVIKIFKSEKLCDSKEIEHSTAYQFMRYCQNCEIPELKKHIATHFNFERHREAAKGFKEFEEFRQYAEENLTDGFILAQWIPTALPVAIDKENPLWIQLKEFMKKSYEAGIINDMSRENFRVDDHNQIQLVDMYEHEDESLSVLMPRLLATFTTDPQEQAWLDPIPVSPPTFGA